MKHKLIIDGNAVYELDLKCAAKKAGKKNCENKQGQKEGDEKIKFRPGLNQPAGCSAGWTPGRGWPL